MYRHSYMCHCFHQLPDFPTRVIAWPKPNKVFTYGSSLPFHTVLLSTSPSDLATTTSCLGLTSAHAARHHFFIRFFPGLKPFLMYSLSDFCHGLLEVNSFFKSGSAHASKLAKVSAVSLPSTTSSKGFHCMNTTVPISRRILRETTNASLTNYDFPSSQVMNGLGHRSGIQ